MLAISRRFLYLHCQAGTLAIAGDDDFRLDVFLELFYVADNADQLVLLAEGGKHADRRVESFLVQGAESFVDEHGFQLDSACMRLNDIGKA